MKVLLWAGSLAVASAYLGGLIYLLVRGGLKIVSFTSYATPPSGVDGEGIYRGLVAALIGAGLGWALGRGRVRGGR